MQKKGEASFGSLSLQLVKKVQKDFFDKLPAKLQNQYL